MEPDLALLLYRGNSYFGSVDEPRRWLLSVINTDLEFAIMASSLMSVGTSHTVSDRVGKVQHMLSRDSIETFIGLDFAIARCESIKPADFPNHELPLTTLRRHRAAWPQNEGELLHW